MKKLLPLTIIMLFSTAMFAQSVNSTKFTQRVLLENDSVLVTEAILPAGESEPVHSHKWASVIYIMEAGDFIDRDGDGKVILDTRKLPMPLTLPFTTWKSPGGPHSVENLSKTIAMRLLRVELKK